MLLYNKMVQKMFSFKSGALKKNRNLDLQPEVHSRDLSVLVSTEGQSSGNLWKDWLFWPHVSMLYIDRKKNTLTCLTVYHILLFSS